MLIWTTFFLVLATALCGSLPVEAKGPSRLTRE